MPWSRALIAATAGAFSLVTAEPRADRDGTLDEQPDRGVLAERGQVDGARSATEVHPLQAGLLARVGRRRQARDLVLLLARDVEHGAAGDDRLDLGRRPQQVGDDRGGRDDLLEVVEDQQQALVAQPVGERLVDRSRGALGDAEGAGDPRRDEHRIADRLERRRRRRRRGSRPMPCAASWSDSRVLPVPPGPVSVSSRVVASRPAAASSSASRPMNVVSWVGRLFGRASSDRRAGKSAGRPAAMTWTIRTGALRSLSRCSPRSRSVTPSTGRSTSWSRTRLEARIWPPWARAAIRAARLMPSPTRLSPDCSAPPVWRPIRTLIVASSGQGSAASARCAATAASTASGASRNATKRESPSVPCSMPPWASLGLAQDRPLALAQLGVAIPTDGLLEPRRALDVAEQEGERPARQRAGLGHPWSTRTAVSAGRLRSGRAGGRPARAGSRG